jgi:hypothetical protein
MDIEGNVTQAPAGRLGRNGFLQAGLAAGLALALAQQAEPVVASKRTKRIRTKRCRPQVEQCVASLTDACAGDPTCLGNLVCCDLFATCNAAAAVACIFADAS